MTNPTPPSGYVVEEVDLTLIELCRACQAPEETVRAWVIEGVIEPKGTRPDEWRFSGGALQRARRAMTLARDLDINVAGVALVLDLLDEIAELRARIERLQSE